MTALKRRKWVRPLIQAIFFLFVAALVFHNWLAETGAISESPVPDLHGLCPFGAVATAGRLLTQGLFVPKTSPANFVSLAAVLLPVLLFGAVFCGWLCPLGSLQEWIGKLGKKILKRRYNAVPAVIDRILSFARYAVLAGFVIATTVSLHLAFSAYDPFYALFHFWTGRAVPSAMAVLAVVLVLSFFVERPWCRWFCPLGALNGLVGLLAPWTIRKADSGPAGSACTGCGRCSRACPMGIDVMKSKAVRDPRCIRCGICLDETAAKGCLTYSLTGGTLPLRGAVLTGLLVIGLFAFPMVLNRSVAALTEANSDATTALSPADITSAMSLSDLAEGFTTSEAEVLSLLGLPVDTPLKTKIRDLEDIIDGLTVTVVKEKMTHFADQRLEL